MRAIYLDNAASTPCDPRVLQKMLPFLGGTFGNPACKHAHGKAAADAVQLARVQVAKVIGAGPDEIVFTSGATEADNLAIKGTARGLEDRGRPLVVTVATEHKAVLGPCAHLEARQGVPTFVLAVGENGLPRMDAIRDAFTYEAGLLSIMAANNETGIAPNLTAIGELCQDRGVLFHTDAAQAFGKIPINVRESEIDLLSISGHKLHGPKGVGALFVRKGIRSPLFPILQGGGQEGDARSGTLNVPGIVGLGCAAEIAESTMRREALRIGKLRARMLRALQIKIRGVNETAPGTPRVPGILHVAFSGARSVEILQRLYGRVSVTSASACVVGTDTPSHVMHAMRHPEPTSTVRFSLGRTTTTTDVDRAVVHVAQAVAGARGA